MPLLILRTRTKPKRPLTALELQILGTMTAQSGPEHRHGPADFADEDGNGLPDARRALSALWRRGLLTRVGWGDTAVYRRKA